MRQWLNDITGFFFPVYCPVCNTPMHVPKQVICLKCEQKMPRTNYVSDMENPVAQLFWGRVQLKGASSLFLFEKGSKYQTLLHLLKYKGAKNVGVFLGKLLGAELMNTPFHQADLIIPVPLHKKREQKRGYNQSEIIALGLEIILSIPVNNKVIFRGEQTDSQTKKNRIERWENMENVFRLCENPCLPENPSFLLIDDVVTTGATLEACAEVLLKIPGAQVSVATVACA